MLADGTFMLGEGGGFLKKQAIFNAATLTWTPVGVPIHTLAQEQCATNLSYGELLIAHSLAAKSGESFTNVVAIRNRTRTWGDLARQLQVDPDFVITRANLAATRIRLVEFRTRRRPQREGGTNYTSINPHTQSARLR